MRSIWSWSAPDIRKKNCAYVDFKTARRLIRPWSKNGLLNARVLDLAMTVLSRSKNAAVLAGPWAAGTLCGAVRCVAAEAETVTGFRIGPTSDTTRCGVQKWQFKPRVGDCNKLRRDCSRWQEGLASLRRRLCIVSITRLMPGVYQPDPPGLI